MKNIFEIMKDYGLEVPEDKKKDFEKAVLENYKTAADYEKQTDKVTNLTEQLNETKEAMKKFEGVDPEDLKNQIADLNQKLTDKDTEYQTKLADRDFQDNVKGVIAKYKGKNEKAIREYIQNQLQEDKLADQMSLKEFIDPFTGEPVK